MSNFLFLFLPSVIAALFVLVYAYQPYKEFLSLRKIHLTILRKNMPVDATPMTFGFVQFITEKDIGVTLPRGTRLVTDDAGLTTAIIPLWK
jgi:hypothetical protein